MACNLLFFYKKSPGQLHVGLPLLDEIKKESHDLRFFFIFQNKEAYDNISSTYKTIINQMGNIIIGQKHTMLCLIKCYLQNNYIFTCLTGHTRMSRIADEFLPFKQLVFFPHGYGLQGFISNGYNLSSIRPEKYASRCSPAIAIVNRKEDIPAHKARKIGDGNFYVSGFPGYKKEWVDYILDIEKYIHQDFIKDITAKDYKKVIFVPMRGPHQYYLTQENSDYLVRSIKWMAAQCPQSLFILKPHPRQSNIEQVQELCKCKHGNIVIRYESSLFLSSQADFVVSFWSSVIIDTIATGTPVIEFHRHQQMHHNVVQTEQGVQSIYALSGLCHHFTDREDVLDFLDHDMAWPNYKDQQRAVFLEMTRLNQETGFAKDVLLRLKQQPFKPICYIGNQLRLVFKLIKYIAHPQSYKPKTIH